MTALKERDIHKGIVQLLKLCARDDCVWFHVANERRCSPKEGAFLKSLGVLKGVPDFVIVTFPARISFLEVKRPGEYLSTEQKQFRDRVEALGCIYSIAHSTDEAKEKLGEMGVFRAPQTLARAA